MAMSETEEDTTETAALWAEGRRRYKSIRNLVERYRGQLPKSELSDIAWELGVSRATLYRLISLYRRFGIVEALVPKSTGRKVGTQVLSKAVERIIGETIHTVYLKPTRPTLTYLVDEVHQRCNENGLPLPHRRTIRSRMQAIDARVRALRRRDAKAIKATTATPGRYSVSRPLEVIQIDHTEVDIIVVDEQNRKPLPNRPWLTLAIDVFTRMVAGYHVSMNPPYRVSVGLCLLHSIFSKTSWLNERAIEQEWPIAGLPEAVHVDNAAEFKSRAFVQACENEGVSVLYRPPAQPRYGGHIERLIGTVMGAVHLLPGTTFANPIERGNYDPKSAAVMTLRELENYLAVEIAGSYHQRIHASLQRPPIAVWREFSPYVALRMPRDRMSFWVSFLPDERRQLRTDGLHLFGLRYWSGALARDVGRVKEKILVKYDPRDISKVFVGRPSGGFIEVRWSNLTSPAVSLHEWRLALKERNKDARDERDTATIMKAIVKKRQIVDAATKATHAIRKTAVGNSRPSIDHEGFGSLKGVDSRIPVPGEE
jgi:putative transposase